MSAPAELERDAEATALYRFYDSGGSLLYVGVTGNFSLRLVQHDRDQPWWHLVASTTLEHYDDRPTALAAEAEAIERECPRFNKRLVHGKMVMRSLRVPEKLWLAAKDKADEREENISDVIRDALVRYVKEDDK